LKHFFATELGILEKGLSYISAVKPHFAIHLIWARGGGEGGGE